MAFNQANTLCSGLMKSSGDLTGGAAPYIDPFFNEFRVIADKHFDLAGRVKDDISQKGNFNAGTFKKEHAGIADNYKAYINKNPESEYSKTALTAIAQIYSTLKDSIIPPPYDAGYVKITGILIFDPIYIKEYTFLDRTHNYFF